MVASLSAGLLLVGCSSASPASTVAVEDSGESTALQQQAYMLQQAIPKSVNVTTTSLKPTGFLLPEFTCEGTDSSPHIAWDDVPSDTQSIAVVAEDLDFVGAVASHWVVWGLPPDTRKLPAGASGSGGLPAGAVEGVNSYGQPGYKGPCPPPKIIASSAQCPHSGFDSDPYLWSVYAVGKEVSLGSDATRDDLLRAMEGNVVASGSLDVKYISKVLISDSECRSGKPA